MASLSSKLKNTLKNTLNRNIDNVLDKVFQFDDPNDDNLTSPKLTSINQTNNNEKKFLCKYQVANLVLMNKSENVTLDHSNILAIEYLNDYEFNIMALLKVTLRMDVRKKLWILKNKKDILVKFELNKIGMDTDTEKFITNPENVWNLEFSAYFNDEDEATDTDSMESRINLNEGQDFRSNDKNNENYFETQNTLDIYLVLPELIKASRYSSNKIYTESTLQNIIGHMLTESGHKHVLMSKIENDEIYKELLIPVNPLYKNLIYLDQYYGLYKKGAIIYYDIDVLYILNANGKVTAKRKDEWCETTFLVSNISNSVPGNGMIRKSGEKIFYPTISDMDINPQNFAVSKNAQLGSSAKIVVTDTTDIEIHHADQSYVNQRNENVTFIKDKNKFTGTVVKSRMEENDCILYISGNNLDINAFKPNKTFKIAFDETSKQKLYGNNTYRLAYAYHYLKLESEGYMSSSHRIILKKVSPSNTDNNKNSNNNSSTNNSSNILGNAINLLTSEIGNFENRINNSINNITSKINSTINNTIDKSITSITNKMNKSISKTVDKIKSKLKNNS